jgi:4-carboxymuconolactone decarboxylase
MVQREELPEGERRFYDAVKAIRGRPISGPFITLMNSSPDLTSRYAHLGHYFHARGQADESILSLRVRTLVALILSRTLNCVYEWSGWVNWALEAGLPQETVDAIRDRRPPPHPTGEDSLVMDFCAQLMTGSHRVNKATYSAALEHFGTQGIVELATTLGYFAMLAYPLNAFEIRLSAEQVRMREPVDLSLPF